MAGLLKITGDTTKVIIDTPEGLVEIIRTKNDMQLIDGVLQAMVPVVGVRPVGELEVLDALKSHDFRVVDMREPKWRLKSTIPGSISIPYIINSNNPTTRVIEKIGHANLLRRLPSDENSEQVYERKNNDQGQTKIDIIV